MSKTILSQIYDIVEQFDFFIYLKIKLKC